MLSSIHCEITETDKVKDQRMLYGFILRTKASYYTQSKPRRKPKSRQQRLVAEVSQITSSRGGFLKVGPGISAEDEPLAPLKIPLPFPLAIRSEKVSGLKRLLLG